MTNDVLPGVEGPGSYRPARAIGVEETIRSARRRAAVHDLLDALVLIGVDAAFLFWPDARLPFTSRGVTVTLLIGVHLLFLASILFTRRWPLWRARLVASTWSRAEQARFTVAPARTSRRAH